MLHDNGFSRVDAHQRSTAAEESLCMATIELLLLCVGAQQT